MGRGVAEKTGEALWVPAGLSMDPLSLDIMIVIVVVAEAFFAKVGVFEGVFVGRVTAVAGDKGVELVGRVGVGTEETD
jgi:hypothetical protein